MQQRPVTSTWSSKLTYVSVLIIVGTEAYGIALALAWALGGYLELGQSITTVLYGIGFVIATGVMYQFARMSYGLDERLEARARNAADYDLS
jgi:hypothetical protein